MAARSLARTDVAHVRPMIAAFVLATLGGGIIAWLFILPVPAIFSGVLLITLVAAYVVARRSAVRPSGTIMT